MDSGSEAVPTESEASIGEESDSSESYSSGSSEWEDSSQEKASTSDTNSKFKCNHCDKVFRTKAVAYKHTGKCKERQDIVRIMKCNWCNLEFKNRGNLATHAFHMHGDSSYKAIIQNESHAWPECNVCHHKFPQKYQLRYHIRKMHFNLQAKQPYAELKRVNQVWFEKVRNSENIMEIKKTGRNTLVMRKLDDNTAIKVREVETETIDLSDMYPCDRRQSKVRCDLCHGMYNKKDLPKHTQEVHLNIRKHSCNNCNRTFKRSYQYLSHICNKQRKVRGVRSSKNSDVRITSVESLGIPWAS